MLLLGYVAVLEVQGPITPASAEYVERRITRAQDASWIVLVLNTPGGLDEAMRVGVRAILNSKAPVCVFVYPAGARCASAGVFWAAAAQRIAMAPGTAIGAAHPVAIGQADSVLLEKAAQDAAAYLRSLFARRGRPQRWADEMVLRSRSLSAEEALREGVADTVVGSVRELIRWLGAEGEEVREMPMGLRERVLQLLSDPNVAYILFMIGIYGLLFELMHPGSIFPGVAGVISLILAFYAFQTLPVNYAGLLLIVLGLGLMLLDVKVPSHGVLTGGGVISLIIGSLMLFQADVPYLRLSWVTIAAVVGATLLLFLFVIGKALQAQFWKPTTGAEGLVGERGEAREDIPKGKKGLVFVHGELWKALALEEIREGNEVEVAEVRGLLLVVRRASPEERE